MILLISAKDQDNDLNEIDWVRLTRPQSSSRNAHGGEFGDQSVGIQLKANAFNAF